MKKLLFMALTIFTCGAASALPVGNPAEASLLCTGIFCDGDCCYELWDFFCDPCSSWCDAFSGRIGFYGDYVFNRHLERKNAAGGNVDKVEMYTNAGYIALNAFDQFDFFATLGATSMRLDSNAVVFGGANGERLDVEMDSEFSWSVGGHITLYEWCGYMLGVEGQYFRYKPDVTRVTRAASESVYPDETVDLKYWEGQFGVGISYRIHQLVPYVAVKWSWACLETENPLIDFTTGTDVTLFDLENQKLWGWAIGVSLVDCEKAAVTVEGRFGDEKGVYVNGQLRF